MVTHCVSLPSSLSEVSLVRVESFVQTPTYHSVLTFVVLPEAEQLTFLAMATRSAHKPVLPNEHVRLVVHSHRSRAVASP
jgi:hypothetical protein